MVQSQQKINLLYLLVLLINMLQLLNLFYCCLMVCLLLDHIFFLLRFNQVLLLVRIFLFSFMEIWLDFYLLTLLNFILLIRRLFLGYFMILFGLEFLLKRCQLLLFFGWMVEVAVVTLTTMPLHVEVAVLPVLSQMHKGTVLLPARTTLKVSTNFSSLHQQKILKFNILICLESVKTILFQLIKPCTVIGHYFVSNNKNILIVEFYRIMSNKDQNKIKPFQIYTKIQEAYPAHYSNLVNKELGYDTLIERGDDKQSIKIKNCICSARANSQLYKRFSRNFISNMKNEINQLIIFTSADPQSRLETSIGLQTNPGLFLIVGLTFLDEKYKQPYHRCQVQFSFMEFREGQMYDLLCFNQKPLKPQRQSSTQKFVNFRQHWVKTTTFNQFIKYFKIALFNNKDRDFKSQSKDSKCRSTFIMKARSKIFDSEDQLVKEHETILLDYQSNCQKENIEQSKEKSNKSVLDYFLIEINNSNLSNKPIHYHLVQQNPLLLLLKKCLPNNIQSNEDKKLIQPTTNSQIIFIHSFPAQKEQFDQNYSHIQNINSYISDEWQVRLEPKIKKISKLNQQKVRNYLTSISNGVSINTYSSLRGFNSFKQFLMNQIKRNKFTVKQFKKIIAQLLKQKLELYFLKNEMIAYQFKLIGSCIKSDHFKDFYNAKSYLQLAREIKIKTQQVREEINDKNAKIQCVQKNFQTLQKKEVQNISRSKQIMSCQPVETLPFQALNSNKNGPISFNHSKNFSWAASSATKFKKINVFKGQHSQKQEMFNLSLYLYEYVNSLWDKIALNDERTVSLSVHLERDINGQQDRLNQLMNKFTEDIHAIRETDIMYEQQNNLYNNNQAALFRSLNFLGMLGPKKTVGQLQIGKRIILQQKQRYSLKKQKTVKKYSKLPAITTKNMVITGDLKISQMISNPFQQDRQSFIRSVIFQAPYNS